MKVLEIVFEKILQMGVEAAFVIAAVLLIRMLMKRFPRKYAYLLWLIVGIRLVCPVALSSSLSLFNLQFILGQDYLTAGQQTEYDTGFAVFGEDKTAHAEPEKNVLEPAADTGNHTMDTGNVKNPAESSVAAPSVSRMEVLAVVWLVGMMLLLSWNLYLTVRMRHKLQKAVLYQDNIYECDGIAAPFVLGLFCPRIYMPFRLSEEEREYILRHERYHIRRRDPVIKAAAFLILSVYWFHPLVWISWLCMTRDMEMSCDEYVLGSMDRDIRAQYSQSLLAFALNRRHLPDLYEETDRICKTELGYQRIEPSRIKDVVSAEISYKRKKSDRKTYRQTVNDKSKLETLEMILSEAEDMRGSSACPFGEAVLTLKLKDGEKIQLTWADDDCRVIRINGVYYEYIDQYLSFSPYGIRALFNKIPWRAIEQS